MYDLIYAGKDAENDVRKLFPGAEIEDATDETRRECFSVALGMDTSEYRQKILDGGLALRSFDFRLFMALKPDEAKKMVAKWAASKEAGNG